MKIFIMRHGQTVSNQKGIIQGRTNGRLSETGKLQATESSKYFIDKKIDCIICSPLMRTVQTSKIVNNITNCKILKNTNLIEIDQGEFSGKVFKNLPQKERQDYIERKDGYGLEDKLSLLKRTSEFFEDLKVKFAEKSVLIVSHNAVCSMLEQIISGTVEKSEDIPGSFKNAEVKSFEI